ncbi:hypothetical protein K8T06_17965 [bacterium]|nr:hypothetical protein [bacterium]
MKFKYPEGATPIDPNEANGLRLTHITARSELDRWEQDNILDCPRFTWGDQDLSKPSSVRRKYIAALHAADESDYQQLLEFVRS